MKIGLVGLRLVVTALASDQLRLHIRVTSFFAEAPSGHSSAATEPVGMDRPWDVQIQMTLLGERKMPPPRPETQAFRTAAPVLFPSFTRPPPAKCK